MVLPWPWRLPTLAMKPWRMVPELDRFDDAECRAYFAAQARPRLVALVVAFPIAMVVGMVLMEAMTVWGEVLFGRSAQFSETLGGRAYAVGAGTFVVSIGACAALTPYCLVLRAVIRRHIADVRCSNCGYVLIGLPVHAGRVVCPECGADHDLKSEGLREEDIALGARVREGRGGAGVPRRPWLILCAAAGGLAALWIITAWAWVSAAALLVALYGMSFVAGRTAMKSRRL